MAASDGEREEPAAALSARGNATRSELMDAGLRVLQTKSILDTTVDDIVREAGVARGTFYIYFTDKYDLLMALAERQNQRLFETSHLTLNRKLSPFDRITESLHRVLLNWTENAGLYRSVVQMALVRQDFLELNQSERAIYIQRIKSDIDRSIAKGYAKPIDTTVAARALSAMMDWLCLVWFALGEEPYEGASKELERVARTLARLWYRAIYAADPPAAGEVPDTAG